MIKSAQVTFLNRDGQFLKVKVTFALFSIALCSKREAISLEVVVTKGFFRAGFILMLLSEFLLYFGHTYLTSSRVGRHFVGNFGPR